jgi:hypothetical protein
MIDVFSRDSCTMFDRDDRRMETVAKSAAFRNACSVIIVCSLSL